MPFKKGHAKFGGKIAGDSLKLRAEAACRKLGVDPFEYFATVVKDTTEETRDRAFCAKQLADRIEPAIKSIEHTGPAAVHPGIQVVFVDAKDQIGTSEVSPQAILPVRPS